MMRRLLSIAFTAAALTLTFSSNTVVIAKESEGILNKLLAPGPLIEGHKDLEKADCLQCHDAGKGVPDAKCLACHKEIRAFVEQKRGYHGLHTDSCIHCHSDHKGRTYDSTVIDKKTFDHNDTGYKLEGKHAEIQCEKCHVETRGQVEPPKFTRLNDPHYMGKNSSCTVCHKNDDVHFFKGPWAKKDCSFCHGLKSWHEDIKFDHTRDVNYKLVGKHAEMKCAECHVPKKTRASAIYKWPTLKSKQCMACHADYHGDRMGKKYRGGRCDTCHGQQTWKLESFDHSKTGYPLRGKHAEIKCEGCHKQKKYSPPLVYPNRNFNYTGLSPRCLACHKDEHLYGTHHTKSIRDLNKCQVCHTEKDWKDIHGWDHNADTRYPIDGKHEGLACSECHIPQKHMKPPRPAKTGIYFWPYLSSKTCENCHKNPHVGKFSPQLLKKKCTECHVTLGWEISGNKGGFDHTKTRFPLTGAHTKVKCNDCHVVNKTQQWKFANSEQKFCIDCHTNVHKTQFHAKFSSQACTSCHTTKNWSERLPFDHNTTSYPLKDSHAKLKCEECHKPTNVAFNLSKDIRVGPKGQKPVMSQFIFHELGQKDCSTCHSDYHQGQLGQWCSTCHNEKSWKNVTFDHNKQSRYPLLGQHADLECDECHRAIPGKMVSFEKKNYPLVRYKPLPTNCGDCHKDPHHGKFGARCNECHVETDWKLTRDFHRNFTLYGVHYTIGCNECHIDSRRLAGMSQDCVVCHAKDDRHNGTLMKCGECHKQQFWENVEFKHSLTQFPLIGAHRTIDCIQCHQNNIYRGLPSNCFSCHQADFVNENAVNAGHAAFGTQCVQCHNTFSFANANP